MKSYTVKNLSAGVLFAILGIGLVLCFGGLALVPKPEDNEYSSLLFWLCFLCPVMLGYVAAKKLTVREQIVTLTDKALSIRSAATLNEQSIPLLQIKSYVYEGHNDGKLLRLLLHCGKKIVFRHNDAWGKDDFYVLVADFEKSVDSISGVANGGMVSIEREPSFYEKPLANVIGWIVVVALISFTMYLLLNGVNGEKWGSLFMIYGNGLAYLGSWLAARRNAQS